MAEDDGATGRGSARLAGIAVRILLLLALVIGGTWAAHEIRDALNLQIMPVNERQVHWVIMAGALAYVGLLALPFVPGAEIGIAMLTAFGAAIAPLVYGATVLAMLLAYAVGRLLPIAALARLLGALRMRRAAALVARLAPLDREARLALLLEGAPARVLGLALRHRYVALGLAVNLPGNSVIGGGGGIMMMAGLSGLFAPLQVVLTVMVAVSPVPLVVMLLGV